MKLVEVRDKWREYYAELYNRNVVGNHDDVYFQENETQEITLEKVRVAIGCMKTGKNPTTFLPELLKLECEVEV